MPLCPEAARFYPALGTTLKKGFTEPCWSPSPCSLFEHKIFFICWGIHGNPRVFLYWKETALPSSDDASPDNKKDDEVEDLDETTSEFLSYVGHSLQRKEAEMSMNEEVPRIAKKDFDTLCPFCKSRAVYRSGAHSAEAEGLFKTPYDPGSCVEEWRCAVCFRTFELV
jgi:hypothetical protein